LKWKINLAGFLLADIDKFNICKNLFILILNYASLKKFQRRIQLQANTIQLILFARIFRA